MASLTDEVSKKMFDAAPEMALKGAKTAKDTLKIGGKTIKGICLILGKGTEFTTQNLMKAVRDLSALI